jgi:hypothetical protein
MSELADANINYIVKYSDIPTMDTEYTSDETDSDFSYINNILVIQDLIRAIRERCPKIRYTFKDDDSYNSYKKDVQSIIDRRSTNFASMSVEFMTDEVDDKCIYAVLTVAAKDFIERENFKIIAVNN